jgi:hypothetical protein
MNNKTLYTNNKPKIINIQNTYNKKNPSTYTFIKHIQTYIQNEKKKKEKKNIKAHLYV